MDMINEIKEQLDRTRRRGDALLVFCTRPDFPQEMSVNLVCELPRTFTPITLHNIEEEEQKCLLVVRRESGHEVNH